MPKSNDKPKKPSRNIPERTKILLAVCAGGRCEFAGCNEYLFDHPLTLQAGNFSENAHIVAFSEIGPRGASGERPSDINDAGNLMLMCAKCHKLVDDRPDDYPRDVLEKYKTEHEARIRHVTSLGPDLRTSVVQLKAKIAGSVVDIPAPQIYQAVAPRYPIDKQGYVVDISSYGFENREEYYRLAEREIKQRVTRLYDPGMDVETTRHISLFALAPIPVLVLLGRSLSNKIPVEMYQRHRSGENPWAWKTHGVAARYKVQTIRKGRDTTKVGLMLSLSGSIDVAAVPLSDDYWLYELALDSEPPNVDFLRQRSDLEAFRATYRRLLSDLMRDHPTLSVLHLFPATPAPIAVACGHDLLPKVHPTLSVYDYDRVAGFAARLSVNQPET